MSAQNRLAHAVVLVLAVPLFAQVTQRVSVSTSGVQGDATSFGQPTISSDGRFIAFDSIATNLVPGDTNAVSDIFLRDRQLGTLERVSEDSFAVQSDGPSIGPAMSSDGRFVAYISHGTNLVVGDTNGVEDVFVRDRQLGLTERVSLDSLGSESDGDSFYPAISADGRYVVFMSEATTLVPGDTNGRRDVFLRDRQTGVTERASVDSAGAQGDDDCGFYPSVSFDGRYVLIHSGATNLVPGDTNGSFDIFLRDRMLETTERISVATGGGEGNSHSGVPTITDDGRYVTFQSTASNLVPGDTNGTIDVFLRDRQLGTTVRLSVDAIGTQGNNLCEYCIISGNGCCVVFSGNASNLVPGDTNGVKDIFFRDLSAGTIERISVSSWGAQGDALSYYFPTISPDGRFAAFSSLASTLVPDDTNASHDVFLYDRVDASYASSCEPGVAGVIACPCGNPPAGFRRGCDNSSATGGARLGASGGAYLSSDSVVFATSGEKPTALSIVLQGTVFLPAGAVFGQGVRCVGGALKRLYTKSAVGGVIVAPDFGAGDLMVHARSAALGDSIASGASRWYMVYYRDPIVLGGCPAESTFNGTQTLQAAWSP